jgi:hypothetical protein
MPDYKQGKIYTIRCKTDDTLIYVGSTVQSLSERMAKHRYDSIKRSNNFFYQHIDDWDNWYIELYENFPCENKEELNKREGQIIREKGTLNKNIAGRTYKDWINDNKHKMDQYFKEYKENEVNKERKKERNKEYYEANKTKLLDNMKHYQQENKGKKCEYKKEYRKKKHLNKHNK